MTTPGKYRSPLDRAVQTARPPEYAALKEALARAGINQALFERYVSGQRVPAPWLRRAMATAIGYEAEELWPGLAPKPTEKREPPRAAWRPMQR